MNKKTLTTILILVTVAGLLFSGYLSYMELSGQGASCTITTQILGLPTCVFGFMMYAIILLLAILIVRS
jgi:uncharacterized membrane protein